MNLISRKAAALKLGLSNVYSSDTFIVSYPKSGNTWLRFIIANMLTKELVTMKNIDEFVPDIYNFKKQINAKSEPRFIKTHNVNLKQYPKTIYIHRDYRDVLVSYYHFQKNLNQYNGDLSSFIKEIDTPFGLWNNHVTEAFNFKNNSPDRILFLSYDELLANLKDNVERIAQFCDLTPVKSIEEIVELCSFESLKNVEDKHGRTFDTPNLTFFRSGRSKQWQTELSKEDQEFINTQNSDLFKKLNYQID